MLPPQEDAATFHLLELKLQMREAVEIELGLNHPGTDYIVFY